MAKILEQELSTYEQHHAELLGKYEGKLPELHRYLRSENATVRVALG